MHVHQEYENNEESDVSDIVASLRENRQIVRDRLVCLRQDISLVNALEEFAGSVAYKEALTEQDKKDYNVLLQQNQTAPLVETDYRQVSLESFESLLSAASSVQKTAENIKGRAVGAATTITEGAVAGARFAEMLYDRIKSNIVRLAASWDFVCSMVEKRWLGVSQLVRVYDLQHKGLVEKFESSAKENLHAFFTVKLYAAKLRSDGRDIHKKEVLLEALENDSAGIYDLGALFLNSLNTIKEKDKTVSAALTLRLPYKKALSQNLNAVNGLLKGLSSNALFTEGGFIKGYQAQSRTLLGGKVIHIGYNQEPVEESAVRKDVKLFISNLNFSSIKKRDGSANDTEVVEVEAMTFKEAKLIFSAVEKTNDALRNYHSAKVPDFLKQRTVVTTLLTFSAGLTGGAGAFDTIQRFFKNDDNLKAFNLVAPAAVSKLLGTFLAASSFAVFGGIVAGAAAVYLVDYLRKYIVANLFSMMDLQYKVTDIIERFDHDYIDTLIEVHNQGYRVCKKLASARNWD